MRVPALAAIVLLAALSTFAPTLAPAHLRPIGGSLVELVGQADTIVVARALAATRDRADAKSKGPLVETRFQRLETIAGEAPPLEFEVSGDDPPLRYAEGQSAIVLLDRTGDGWRAVQPAGMAFVIEGEGSSSKLFVDLWEATRGERTPGRLAPILRSGLRSPIRKIRLLSALDLAELVDHSDPVPAGLVDELRADLADPTIDPLVRPALSGALPRATRR